jgi:hypothetical protein
MWVLAQAFHVPKHGASQAEYEDAFWPAQACRRNVSRFRCAVADGATESVFAREWAWLLVRGFARRRLRIRRLQRAWGRVAGPSRTASGPWYVQAKVSKGAHAALVGLSIREGRASNPPGGTWRVLAVGDCCAFHVRGGDLLTHGPVTRSSDFGNSPCLLSTTGPSAVRRHAPDVKVLSGTWQSRDAFYLASDAMAQWMLALLEDGGSPWKDLCELGTDRASRSFERLVADLRGCRAMRNDDTTLLRVEVA